MRALPGRHKAEDPGVRQGTSQVYIRRPMAGQVDLVRAYCGKL